MLEFPPRRPGHLFTYKRLLGSRLRFCPFTTHPDVRREALVTLPRTARPSWSFTERARFTFSDLLCTTS